MHVNLLQVLFVDDQDKHIHDATGVCLTFKSRHEEQSDGNMLDLRVLLQQGELFTFTLVTITTTTCV